jgi:micrococcal nuclease
MPAEHTFDGESWEFPGRLAADGVVDGDTIDVVLDLGFNTRKTTRLRLFGVDSAESYGVAQDSEEYQRGQEHAAFVAAWLCDAADGSEWPLDVTTLKQAGKYGRWIALIHRRTDGESLTSALIDEFDDV